MQRFCGLNWNRKSNISCKFAMARKIVGNLLRIICNGKTTCPGLFIDCWTFFTTIEIFSHFNSIILISIEQIQFMKIYSRIKLFKWQWILLQLIFFTSKPSQNVIFLLLKRILKDFLAHFLFYFEKTIVVEMTQLKRER